MTTKEFIEKAIEGGYDPKYIGKTVHEADLRKIDWLLFRNHSVVLDPKAWEAVGKVEGWKIHEVLGKASESIIAIKPTYDWQGKMHEMIDHLVEEGTIESYLEKL